jgi:hypothetical protein
MIVPTTRLANEVIMEKTKKEKGVEEEYSD